MVAQTHLRGALSVAKMLALVHRQAASAAAEAVAL